MAWVSPPPLRRELLPLERALGHPPPRLSKSWQVVANRRALQQQCNREREYGITDQRIEMAIASPHLST